MEEGLLIQEKRIIAEAEIREGPADVRIEGAPRKTGV